MIHSLRRPYMIKIKMLTTLIPSRLDKRYAESDERA